MFKFKHDMKFRIWTWGLKAPEGAIVKRLENILPGGLWSAHRIENSSISEAVLRGTKYGCLAFWQVLAQYLGSHE